VLDIYRQNLAIPKIANCLKKIDDWLLKPEIFEADFFARTILGTHLEGLYDSWTRRKHRRTAAHAEGLNSAEVY